MSLVVVFEDDVLQEVGVDGVEARKRLVQYDEFGFVQDGGDVLELGETKELISILEDANFLPELIIKYDRPRFGKILPNEYIKKIYD